MLGTSESEAEEQMKRVKINCQFVSGRGSSGESEARKTCKASERHRVIAGSLQGAVRVMHFQSVAPSLPPVSEQNQAVSCLAV
ncbi:MAG: hypothetical protein H7346_24175 [Burkholderiaceae bacterium]|nr:hypothetical protein [Burkholderiaceae bacterium]